VLEQAAQPIVSKAIISAFVVFIFRGVSKFRNPKAEGRKKPEIRRPKSDAREFGCGNFIAGLLLIRP
jgi:hypothetical protein